MKSHKKYLVSGAALFLIGLLLAFPIQKAAQIPPPTQLIAQSSILSSLASGAVFPFIDTTPRGISRAHIAITDATSSCSAGAAAPASIQVLVGQAGVALVNVMNIVVHNNGGSALTGVNTVTASAEVK